MLAASSQRTEAARMEGAASSIEAGVWAWQPVGLAVGLGLGLGLPEPLGWILVVACLLPLAAATGVAYRGRGLLRAGPLLERLQTAGLEPGSGCWFPPRPVVPRGGGRALELVWACLAALALLMLLAGRLIASDEPLLIVGLPTCVLCAPALLGLQLAFVDRVLRRVGRLTLLRIHCNTLRLPRPRDVPAHELPAGLEQPETGSSGWLARCLTATCLLMACGLVLCGLGALRSLGLRDPILSSGALLPCLGIGSATALAGSWAISLEQVLAALLRRERALAHGAMGLSVVDFPRPRFEGLNLVASLVPRALEVICLSCAAAAWLVGAAWASLVLWLALALAWQSLRAWGVWLQQLSQLLERVCQGQDALLNQLEGRAGALPQES